MKYEGFEDLPVRKSAVELSVRMFDPTEDEAEQKERAEQTEREAWK